MEKPTKPQNLYVRQRKWATWFFALLALVLFACVVLLPIAFAVNPAEDVTEKEIKILVSLFSAAAVVFGIPLLFVSVALFVKLRLKFVIYTDEKGIYLNSTVVPYGLIPWDNIKAITYHGVFDAASALLAPDTNHLRIVLKSKKRFTAGLNFLQKLYYRVNFTGLFCNLALCKIKGAKLGAELNEALKYYTGDNDSGE